MSPDADGSLIVCEDAVNVLVDDVARFGALGVETCGFLLGARQTPTAETVALAGSAGISRSSQSFSASASAIAALFDWAADDDLRILAQVHSHRRSAFLSRTDLRHGFAVANFITSVIPWFRNPPRDPSMWGWWRYDGTWCEIPAPRFTSGTLRVVQFDETGVRCV